MWNTTVLFEKRYQLIHWMEHWNKPPWHCKLPLKRTLVNFQEKKIWFDQKGIDVKEHRKGVYLHHDKKCPMTLKNKACCRPSCSKCLKKLHKTCWGTSLECRISFLSKDNHLKIKKKKKERHHCRWWVHTIHLNMVVGQRTRQPTFSVNAFHV